MNEIISTILSAVSGAKGLEILKAITSGDKDAIIRIAEEYAGENLAVSVIDRFRDSGDELIRQIRIGWKERLVAAGYRKGDGSGEYAGLDGSEMLSLLVDEIREETP